MVKNLPAMQVTRVQPLGWEDLLEKRMATYSSVLAWRTPWTEEPGGLQSMGSQRVGHNWATNTTTNLNSHIWLRDTIMDSTVKKTNQDLIFCFIFTVVKKDLWLKVHCVRFTTMIKIIYYLGCRILALYLREENLASIPQNSVQLQVIFTSNIEVYMLYTLYTILYQSSICWGSISQLF